MALRLVLGLVKGLFVGGAIFAALFYGLHVAVLVGWQLYAVVTLAGALTGLVAGKAIWQTDGKIEAGLKAFVGALIAPAALWAVLKWAPIPAIAKEGVPDGSIGLAAWSVAAFTTLIAVLYELDNTPAPEDGKEAKGDAKKATTKKLRAAERNEPSEELDEEIEAPAASRRAKR